MHVRIPASLSIVSVIIAATFSACEDDELSGPGGAAGTPSVHITSPADGAVYYEGEMISFIGGGEDRSGAELPDSMLLWVVDTGDTLGRGAALARDDLSLGPHVVSLTGKGVDGGSDVERVSIKIIERQGMLRVPAVSSFPMGWDLIEPDEMPVHEVSLMPFEIGEHEVTWKLWTKVRTWGESHGYTFAEEGLRGGCPAPPCNTTDADPVTMISWKDCIVWCNAYSEMLGLPPVYYLSSAKVAVLRDPFASGDPGSGCVDWSAGGFRLPTEAEWECAARYIDGAAFNPGSQHSGYDLEGTLDDCAWYGGDSGGSTHPAGMLTANSLGAFDMSGNVWELCWDWYGDGYYDISPASDPRGPETGTMRVIRGGSWATYGSFCRTSNRTGTKPLLIFVDVGFRVCRSVAVHQTSFPDSQDQGARLAPY